MFLYIVIFGKMNDLILNKIFFYPLFPPFCSSPLSSHSPLYPPFYLLLCPSTPFLSLLPLNPSHLSFPLPLYPLPIHPFPYLSSPSILPSPSLPLPIHPLLTPILASSPPSLYPLFHLPLSTLSSTSPPSLSTPPLPPLLSSSRPSYRISLAGLHAKA